MSKIYHTLNHEYIHSRLFPMNAVVLKLDNGMILVCQNFNLKTGKLPLYVYLPKEDKWVLTFKRVISSKDPIPGFMYDYYRQHIYVRHKSRVNYAEMMKHDRKHKNGGGGGTRLGNSGYTTDYECSKNPMHDFRRSMYVQWNQA